MAERVRYPDVPVVGGQRITFRAANRDYWTQGPGSQPITWIAEQPAPQDTDDVARRVDALRSGENQWGCYGAHHGSHGRVDCPEFLHHHHDWRCAPPTERECRMAGVPYRTRWASRG